VDVVGIKTQRRAPPARDVVAGLKIVRRSLPFGKLSGEHGLMFTSYCNTLHNIEVQLLNMFGDADGKTDLLLKHLSKAVSGAYYYAPSVERLQNDTVLTVAEKAVSYAPVSNTKIWKTLTRRCKPKNASDAKTALILAAKYYASTMQSNFDKRTVHSGNLYQIFAYVKNKQVALERAGESVEVSGMLLYAATDEDVQPDATYRMSGNRISATTLDLDRPFEDIRAQLDGIIEEYFPGE